VVKDDLILFTATRPGGSTFNGRISYFSDGGQLGLPGGFTKTTAWVFNPGVSPTIGVFGNSFGWMNIPSNYPIDGVSSFAIGIGSPTKKANKFTPNVNMRVGHVWAVVDIDVTLNVSIYASDGATIIATGSNTANFPALTGSALNLIALNPVSGTDPVELLAGNSYWIAYSAASNSCTGFTFNFGSADLRASMGSYGQMIYSTANTPASPGDWTDDTTKAIIAGIIPSHIDDGAGGGGGAGGGSIFGSKGGVIT
jgi:hypothetical protein